NSENNFFNFFIFRKIITTKYNLKKKLAMPLMKYVGLSTLQKGIRPDIWGISVLS
ncbi:unnamed protein product, partial [Staurois parvus]